MTMNRIVLLITAAVSLAGAVCAQSSANPTIAAEVKQNYQRTKDMILRAASKMPATASGPVSDFDVT